MQWGSVLPSFWYVRMMFSSCEGKWVWVWESSVSERETRHAHCRGYACSRCVGFTRNTLTARQVVEKGEKRRREEGKKILRKLFYLVDGEAVAVNKRCTCGSLEKLWHVLVPEFSGTPDDWCCVSITSSNGRLFENRVALLAVEFKATLGITELRRREKLAVLCFILCADITTVRNGGRHNRKENTKHHLYFFLKTGFLQYSDSQAAACLGRGYLRRRVARGWAMHEYVDPTKVAPHRILHPQPPHVFNHASLHVSQKSCTTSYPFPAALF